MGFLNIFLKLHSLAVSHIGGNKLSTSDDLIDAFVDLLLLLNFKY